MYSPILLKVLCILEAHISNVKLIEILIFFNNILLWEGTIQQHCKLRRYHVSGSALDAGDIISNK